MSMNTVGELRVLLTETLSALEGQPDEREIVSTTISPEDGYSDGVEGCYLQSVSFQEDEDGFHIFMGIL